MPRRKRSNRARSKSSSQEQKKEVSPPEELQVAEQEPAPIIQDPEPSPQIEEHQESQPQQVPQQTQKPKFLMLPVEQNKSLCKRRKVELRKGYYRYTGPTCKSAVNFELKEQDVTFILNQKRNYQVQIEQTTFNLLNQQTLQRIYSYLYAKKCQDKSQEQVKSKIQQFLTRQQQTGIYTLLINFREQKPEVFDTFLTKLALQWSISCNSKNIFTMNQSKQTVQPFKPYAVKVRQKNVNVKWSRIKLRKYQQKMARRTEEIVNKHHMKKVSFDKRKTKFIGTLTQFIQLLVSNGLKIDYNAHQLESMSLNDIGQKLKEVLNILRNMKEQIQSSKDRKKGSRSKVK